MASSNTSSITSIGTTRLNASSASVDWSDPEPVLSMDNCTIQNSSISTGTSVLSKRETIAAMAMQGILTNPHLSELVAKVAVKYADELIEELEKTKA